MGMTEGLEEKALPVSFCPKHKYTNLFFQVLFLLSVDICCSKYLQPVQFAFD